MISSRRSSTRLRRRARRARPRAAPGMRRASASDLGRPQQRLRRHARPERALAADLAVLDDRDLEPGLREPPRRHLAAGPGTDHHHVEARIVSFVARSPARDPLRRPERPRLTDRGTWGLATRRRATRGSRHMERDTPGDDRLRRGRFVGVVASRGAGGLVKPRQQHKCEVSRLRARCLAETRYVSLGPRSLRRDQAESTAGQCPRNARLSRPGRLLIRLALRNPAGVASGGRDPERRTHS